MQTNHTAEFYEKLGKVWHKAAYGQIYVDIQKAFHYKYGYQWINKHINIGKKKYPNYFPQRAKALEKNMQFKLLIIENQKLRSEIKRLRMLAHRGN